MDRAPRPRATLGIVFIACVAGLVWEFGRTRAAGWQSVAAARSSVTTQCSSPDVAPEVASPTPSRIQPARAAESADEADVDEEDGSSEEPVVPRIGIDGQVVVVDRQGVEYSEESGTLVPRFDGAPDADGSFTRSNGDPVAVVRGRFHVEVPEGASLGASYFVLGGRLAELNGISVSVAAGETITLRADWIPSKRLHVRDRETNAELDDVTVLRTEGEGRGAIDGAGSDPVRQLIAEHASSPLALTPPIVDGELATQPDLWFRAPGHAWTRFTVQFEWDREDTVVLAPAAATLVVDVVGALPADGARLRIREDSRARLTANAQEHEPPPPTPPNTPVDPSDDEPDPAADALGEMLSKLFEAAFATRGAALGDVPAQLGASRFDDLEPGAFVVSVEVGDAAEDPLVLAEAKVETRSDAVTHVSLALAADGRSPRVPLAGTLFVPDGWIGPEALKRGSAFALRIEPIGLTGRSRADVQWIGRDAMEPLAGRPGWYRWRAQAVRPATWRFTVEELKFARAVPIGSEGRGDVELVPTEPATVHVRVIDAASGASVRIESLFWRCDGSPSPPMWLEREDGGTGFVAQLPAGVGRFEFADGLWSFEPWTLDDVATRLHGGDQQLDVRAHARTSLMVRFRCHGKLEPRFEGVDDAVVLHAIDHRGETRSTGIFEDGIGIVVSRPGRYRVTIADLPGFRPVEPFDVDLPADTITERVVELRKRSR